MCARRLSQKGIIAALVFGIGSSAWAPAANAQVETVAGLLALADALVSDLKSLVVTTSVEGQKTIGSATKEINGLEGQLRKDVGTNLGIPIQNLGANVQNTANTLKYVVDNVNELITKQRSAPGCRPPHSISSRR
jgi:hypothetical protein